jgi:serine/threonine protein kinase
LNRANNYFSLKLENENGQLKEYLLVLEYAGNNTLQNYLKESYKNLTWDNKYKLAYQLVCTISWLHDKGIVHQDLVIHSLFIILMIVKFNILLIFFYISILVIC